MPSGINSTPSASGMSNLQFEFAVVLLRTVDVEKQVNDIKLSKTNAEAFSSTC